MPTRTLLRALQGADLIERRRCEQDARGADIVITPKGRALRRRMWPIYEEAIARSFADRLDSKELAALNRALLKLYGQQRRSAVVLLR